MTAALHSLLSKFCHIYLDDIVIWSDSLDQHMEHVRLVLAALRDVKLYCNPRKCHFYLLQMNFLGHHISTRGIEANTSRVDKILNWPIPWNMTDVWSFLRLLHYITLFLTKVADFTCILTPLMTKRHAVHSPLGLWNTKWLLMPSNPLWLVVNVSQQLTIPT